MAFVNIKNARVDRIIKDIGFVAVESYTTRNGEAKETKYTIWTNRPDEIPGEGVVVNVSGPLSVRIEEFDNEQGEHVTFAAVHVNNPRITLVEDAQPPAESAPNYWASAMASEAPF